ncbi:MauE/DoxX family redox-associated membrane protein [Heyndrickxia oleronia]|uniref:MauE/DoxX family redox-associated membrane protein n=1 Tax=Heyndrickxia oleronia TaxID=38875 RepID=UPI003F86EE5D
MSYIVYMIQVTLAFLFITTAFDKIKNWNKHKISISQYKLLPKRFITYFLFLMVVSELMIAILFYFFSVNIFSVSLLTVIILIYTSAVFINLIRGNTEINCGCGSFLENQELNYGIVIRNIFILGFAFIPFFYDSPLIIHFFFKLFFSLCSVNVLIFIAIIKETRLFVVHSKRIYKVIE